MVATLRGGTRLSARVSLQRTQAADWAGLRPLAAGPAVG